MVNFHGRFAEKMVLGGLMVRIEAVLMGVFVGVGGGGRRGCRWKDIDGDINEGCR